MNENTSGPIRKETRASNILAWLRVRFGPSVLALKSILNGHISDQRIYITRRSDWRRELLRTPHGPVSVSVRSAINTDSQPAVIMVHGSHGPLPLYTLLANRLTRKGCTVLMLDLPGFGRSERPFPPWHEGQFTGKEAVIAAVAFLRDHPDVDSRRISLFGHSLGATVVLHAAERIPDLYKIVAFGPSLRVEERFLGPAAKERLFWLTRFAVSRGLKHFPDEHFVVKFSREFNLEYRLQFWQQHDHPPLLLLDGQLESEKDRAFLEELFHRMTPPVSYKTIPFSDHYLNSAGLCRLVFYDNRAIELCVQWVVDWIMGEMSN
jgi:pimeloyl-ACP methyl ester carboxylesterase